MKVTSGYEADIVVGFLKAQGELRNDGTLAILEDVRLPDHHRQKVERWSGTEYVALKDVDDFLMRYGLMLFELEDWARETYGRDGFFDPHADPMEMVG